MRIQLYFTIVRAPDPIAEFSVNPRDAPIVNPVFNLYNLSIGASSYEWYYLGSLIATTPNTSQMFSTAGDYCFNLVATSDAGCIDSVTHCGVIYDREIVFFPNAFSPNGDMLNDEFGPSLHNIDFQKVKNFSFVIYNRWGELIFESDNPAQRWNGNNKNNGKMEMDVYFYHCKFVTPYGEVYDKQGDVTLVR
jgi:gliding motility-associated-like protein